MPSEEVTQQRALLVKIESLDFFLAEDSASETPTTPAPSVMSETPSIKTYSAMMRFSVDSDGDAKKEVNIDLRNDVYFVTAFPCISSPHTDMLRSPTSPSFPNTKSSLTSSPRNFTGTANHPNRGTSKPRNWIVSFYCVKSTVTVICYDPVFMLGCLQLPSTCCIFISLIHGLLSPILKT
jgi:hypothetical protein